MLDDDVAQEARRRALGQREALQEARHPREGGQALVGKPQLEQPADERVDDRGDLIAPICAAPTSPSCRATTDAGRRPAAWRSSSMSHASLIARRTINGVLASAASRSTSVTTPMTSPRSASTGRWCTPRSTIVSISSAQLAGTGRHAGALITPLTGASSRMPGATTRTRRSWSVRTARPPQQRDDVLSGQPIGEAVLRGASRGARGRPGEHRRVAEPLLRPPRAGRARGRGRRARRCRGG